MKKSIFVIAVASIVLASCVKERCCECTITQKGVVKNQTIKKPEAENS